MWSDPGTPPSTRVSKIMGRHAASKIHPWRTSGVNAPGYSRPPQQAPQRASDDWDRDEPMTVDLGTPSAHSSAHRLAAQATNVKWAPLPSIFVGTPSVRVRVGGVSVVLPGNWEIHTDRSSTGVEFAYCLDALGMLRLVGIRSDGEPGELIDVPFRVLDVIRAHFFPKAQS